MSNREERPPGDVNLPTLDDFPPGTTFLIKEFDVPLARVPAQGWFNWYDGTPRSYDPSSLTVSNNWPARDFDEWVQLIRAGASSAGPFPGV